MRVWFVSIIFLLVILPGEQRLKADFGLDEDLSSYRVNSQDSKELDWVAENFEIVQRLGDHEFLVYVPQSKRDLFEERVSHYHLEEESLVSAFDSVDLLGYRDLASIEEELLDLQSRFPHILSLEEYGRSRGGRPLWAMKISDNVDRDEDEPELMITSSTHGDELITVEVVLNLVHELVEGHSEGSDERLVRMVNEHEIYVLPVINPDGYVRRRRYAGGVDPNRQYPWPERDNPQPVDCIKFLIDFFHSRNFVGSMDVHAYGQMVMYPWAYTRQNIDHDHRRAMTRLVNHMAEENNYLAGQVSKVIYIARGSSADYYYWKAGTTALAIELGTSKAPPASRIPQVVNEAREMFWRFIEAF